MTISALIIPGAVLAGADHTLPDEWPNIRGVTGATIIRVPSAMSATLTHLQIIGALADHGAADVVASLADHAAADVVASLADHAAADVVASLADHAAADVVASIDDHAVHGHDITTVNAAGGGAAMTEPAAPGPLESAGGGQTNPGAVDVLAAAQAHAATAVDVAHGASLVDVAHGASLVDVAHGASLVDVAHGAAAGGPISTTLTGSNPVITILAADITLVDRRTFQLDAVATVLGDMLVLRYQEVGSAPAVA